jgi:hypothetical protein
MGEVDDWFADVRSLAAVERVDVFLETRRMTDPHDSFPIEEEFSLRRIFMPAAETEE